MLLILITKYFSGETALLVASREPGFVFSTSNLENLQDEDFSAEEIEDKYLLDLLGGSVNSKSALKVHLDNKPKCMTVSYDNKLGLQSHTRV